MKKQTSPQNRGFRVMLPEQQREIARMGGLKVSKNRKTMSERGRAGGIATQRKIKAALRAAKRNGK